MKVKNVFWHILFLGVLSGIFFSIAFLFFDKTLRLESFYMIPLIIALAIFAIFVYFLYEYINKIIGRPKEFLLGKTYQVFEWHRMGGLGYYFIMGDETISPHSKREIYHATSIKIKKGNNLIDPINDTDIPIRFQIIVKRKCLISTLRKEYPFYYIIEEV